ncbi:hypothetical protein SKAU_G00011130 [Synaphobranchus kaupii]|uniref:Synaptosomal-associated protein 29 n=1 Tax=Synaphobranchus kaupii TaxID=118154 RepID=A0A9Q1GB48_SYNKA|nr:hypothetical protein SKAU_G00011130 [Synaphobranchus kaupii]
MYGGESWETEPGSQLTKRKPPSLTFRAKTSFNLQPSSHVGRQPAERGGEAAALSAAGGDEDGAVRGGQQPTAPLGLIYESEKIGTETAEELMRQGEALKRTERMVDHMDEDLKTSQRHINSIKSPSSKLQKALSGSKEHEHKYQESHPNLRKMDTSGFGGAEFMSEGNTSSQNGYPKNQHLQTAHQKLDDNLDEMCSGLRPVEEPGSGPTIGDRRSGRLPG